MLKRVLLFVVTNLAVMVTISILMSLLGLGGYRLAGGGLDYTALAVFCLLWGSVGSFISLQMSRWMAKRAMSVQLVDGRSGHEELDWLYRTVERLTRQAQLPMPEVGYYDSPEVNAFATGPSKSRSLVAVSSGLLRRMSRDEVEGVLAHEVAHIQNGDMVTMALIQGIVNAFVMFASRIIANIARNAVDERNGRMVQFLGHHRARHRPRHPRLDGRGLVLARPRVPRRCRRRLARRPRQDDRRAAPPAGHARTRGYGSRRSPP